MLALHNFLGKDELKFHLNMIKLLFRDLWRRNLV